MAAYACLKILKLHNVKVPFLMRWLPFSLFQHLITQYQAKIIDLQQQLGVGPAPLAARMTNAGDVKDTIRMMETENVRRKNCPWLVLDMC